MKKDIFDKETAIKEMKEESRSIISPQYARDLIEPFVPFAKVKKTTAGKVIDETLLPEVAFDLSKRITWYGKKREGVGVNDIAIEIVKMLGEEPHIESPYMGVGRTAEHITMNNLAIICAKLGMETDDCKYIFAWIFPKDFEKLKRLKPKITQEELEKLKGVV
jgi:hypothetical protein